MHFEHAVRIASFCSCSICRFVSEQPLPPLHSPTDVLVNKCVRIYECLRHGSEYAHTGGIPFAELAKSPDSIRVHVSLAVVQVYSSMMIQTTTEYIHTAIVNSLCTYCLVQ